MAECTDIPTARAFGGLAVFSPAPTLGNGLLARVPRSAADTLLDSLMLRLRLIIGLITEFRARVFGF
jgi:hypothetical protein